MKRCGMLLLLLACAPVMAQAAQADQISANHAWIRLLPGPLPAGGYVTLYNHGSAAALIVSIHSTTYTSAMLHQTKLGNNGMSSMVSVDHLAIPPHGKVVLAPGGYHLMLQNAIHSTKPGDTITITLDFADGSHLPVRFLGRPANASD